MEHTVKFQTVKEVKSIILELSEDELADIYMAMGKVGHGHSTYIKLQNVCRDAGMDVEKMGNPYKIR